MAPVPQVLVQRVRREFQDTCAHPHACHSKSLPTNLVFLIIARPGSHGNGDFSVTAPRAKAAGLQSVPPHTRAVTTEGIGDPNGGRPYHAGRSADWRFHHQRMKGVKPYFCKVAAEGLPPRRLSDTLRVTMSTLSLFSAQRWRASLLRHRSKEIESGTHP